MNYKQVSLGLGIFSIGLGLAELLAPRKLAETLGVEGSEGVIRAFGARELVAGAGLIQSPAHSTRVWNRVAGDAMDLGALGLAARRSQRTGAVWGAIAFVAAVTVLDVVTAIGLDTETGRALPSRQGSPTD